MLKSTIKVSPNKIISEIDDRLYSSFIEHMGRAVYTGIFEPGHEKADENGFREDVISLVRPLNLDYVRYPGGNFVSGYNWRDGIGPKEKRPVRMDLAWQAIEPNTFGIDEFCMWCRKAGIKPMIAVNLGTGTPKEAAELVEYCNAPAGQTALSSLRCENGSKEPYDIKLWCLGNEMDGPWQICAKTPIEYARIAHESAKLMKLVDPSIQLVACGSSSAQMPTFGTWERTVLRECWDVVDFISIHSYYQNLDNDRPAFLAQNEKMEEFIHKVASIKDEIKKEKNSQKEVYLSFDEWNVWYHCSKEKQDHALWTCPRPIEEEAYDFDDLLVVSSLLTTLINNSDTVKISCLAQLVNVIAPITTVPGGQSYVRTIYWPFLMACKYGRGTALKQEIQAPAYSCKVKDEASYLASSCVLAKDRKSMYVFAVNKAQEDMALSLIGFEGHMTMWTSLSEAGPKENPICQKEQIVLKALSSNVFCFDINY